MLTNMLPLIITYILNIIDYIFTAYWIKLYGTDIEANPIALWMFNHNVAWVFKIIIVGGLLAALGYLIYRNPKSAWATYIPLTVYGLIVLYHIGIAIYLRII